LKCSRTRKDLHERITRKIQLLNVYIDL